MLNLIGHSTITYPYPAAAEAGKGRLHSGCT